MANPRIQIIIDALNLAGDELKNLEKELAGVQEQAKKASSAADKMRDSFDAVKMAGAGIIAGGFALKKAFDFAKEGAQIELVETRFGRLAESIGTTGSALMNDLAPAMGGMLSNAEMMQAATDLMALGLAKTHDEAVRLASVAGQLNMNMNQLVLTLTNQTTMRFDALGVAVDGFDEKVKALEATGMSANDAFNEAFLQQAEEQLERIGSAVDSTVGKMQRLEAHGKNALDGLKRSAADLLAAGLLPLMDGFAELDNAQRGLVDYYRGAAPTYENYIRLQVAQAIASGDLANNQRDYMVALLLSGNVTEGTAKQFDVMSQATWELANAAGYADKAMLTFALSSSSVGAGYAETMEDMVEITGRMVKEAESADQAMLNYAGSAMVVSQGLSPLTAALREVAGATADVTGSMSNDMAAAAQGMIDEFDYIQAGGVELAQLFDEIGRAEITPRVKQGLLDDALIAAVDFEIALGNISQNEGLRMLREGLDLSSWDEANIKLEEFRTEGMDGLIAKLEEANEGALGLANAKIVELATVMQDNEDGMIDSVGVVSSSLESTLVPQLRDAAGYVSSIISGLLRLSEMGGFDLGFSLGGGGGGGGGATNLSLTTPGGATMGHSGLDFVVPPGYPNDSYGPIYVESGEHVNVTPANQMGNRGGSMQALISPFDMARMATVISRAVRDGIQMGV
jgi:hypothetical protein